MLIVMPQFYHISLCAVGTVSTTSFEAHFTIASQNGSGGAEGKTEKDFKREMLARAGIFLVCGFGEFFAEAIYIIASLSRKKSAGV